MIAIGEGLGRIGRGAVCGWWWHGGGELGAERPEGRGRRGAPLEGG